MNEDVVLPLTALAEFARFTDGLNVEEERFAQGRFVDRAEALLQAATAGQDDPEWLLAKIPRRAGPLPAGPRRAGRRRRQGRCGR